ncbi:hypothetical protein OQA88_4551 [Cercophora sp. LCS_1]
MAPIATSNSTANIFLTACGVDHHVPEAELIAVVGVLFPIFAYPFLPQGKNTKEDDDLPTGRWLQICSLTQLAFIHGPNLLSYVALDPNNEGLGCEGHGLYLTLPAWTVYLNLICLVGASGGIFKTDTSQRGYTREDFMFPTMFVAAILLFEVTRTLSVSFARITSSWVAGIGIALGVMGLFLILVREAGAEEVLEAVQTCLYRFVTREVKGWDWLPVNGATESFENVWSCLLYLVVALWAFGVVTCFWWFASR